MKRRTQFLLALFGVGLALLIGLGALRILRQPSNNISRMPCTSAPGNWYENLLAMLREYREPCAEFYWLPQPTDEFHILVHLNNFGLHAHDYTLEKPPGVYRVLLVGDSFPQGFQVEIEQGFPYLLEQELTRELNRPVQVINLSVDAYGTDRELLLYAALGWQFQPDMVVLAIYSGNDVQDNEIDLEARRYGARLDRPFFTLPEGKQESAALELHNSPAFDGRFSDAPAYQWLIQVQENQTAAPAENLPERPRVTQAAPDYKLEYPVEMGLYLPEDAHWANAWALTEALIVQFRDLVKLQHSSFAALIIPDRRAVQSDDWSKTLSDYGAVRSELRTADPAAPNIRLESFLAGNDIPTLDLMWTLRSWAESNTNGRLYFASDGHFTAEGHAAAAGRIAGWLRTLMGS